MQVAGYYKISLFSTEFQGFKLTIIIAMCKMSGGLWSNTISHMRPNITTWHILEDTFSGKETDQKQNWNITLRVRQLFV